MSIAKANFLTGDRYMAAKIFPLLIMMFLLCSPLGDLQAGEAKPKAADMVTDGQIIDLTSTRYQGLFKELRLRHNFTDQEINTVFKGVRIKRRVLELMDTQWEAKPYYEYYPRFITKDVIKEGKKKLKEFQSLLDQVERQIGVEREIVVAIWGIETRYGRYEGAFDIFQTLNTMFDAYPRRRTFYRKQLVHFLLLCRENNVDPLGVTGSYGGAFGQTQFIPSSFREYAIDFDGDDKVDVWHSIPDIVASIAKYLQRFGWVFNAPIYHEIGATLKNNELTEAYKKGRKGFVSRADVAKMQGLSLPPSPEDKKVTVVGLELKHGGMRYVAGYPNFQAITAWNHSNRYAMAVTELAEKLAEK